MSEAEEAQQQDGAPHYVRIISGFAPAGPYVNLLINEARTGGGRTVIPLDVGKLSGLIRDASEGLALLLAR